MASVKVKFRPSVIQNHEGTIYYQIIHERKTRQLLTKYHIYPCEWDEKKANVTCKATSERWSFIQGIKERIRWDVERIKRIILDFDNEDIGYSAEDIIESFHNYEREYSLFNYMETLIIKFKENGKVRTAETYTSTLNSLKKYRQNQDIMLDNIDSDIIEGYQAYLQNRKVIPNTISFYMRILRAVYNRAVENEIIERHNPFRHVYTGVDKTIKRALPINYVRKIKNMDLSLHPKLDFARDMFMMSFYLRGMSFVDMAFLKKTDLRNGYIIYRRRKTGQQLLIEWKPEMQAILDKYPINQTDYLLPIIKSKGVNERGVYRHTSFSINRNLKQIAELIGISLPLTLYVARHSWASVAKSQGIPISVISEGMGHDSEATTQIYLASLDSSVIDKANSLIINLL